ncbi:PREDICTED: putative peptidyl-tRNA hydrolase PTRHD1, partial [Pygoscelis adeliae]|uniref:putative peptidyl-tRNA hydrolase PTRHD1 n=1 Tax=Pygoscelis adeliae TaxID=9238 RepID=UPI0004F4D5EE
GASGRSSGSPRVDAGSGRAVCLSTRRQASFLGEKPAFLKVCNQRWFITPRLRPPVLAEAGGAVRACQEQDAFWAPDEAALRALAETLKQHSIDHEVWTEQPENTATCLALRPYPKDQVHQHLKKFKLLK